MLSSPKHPLIQKHFFDLLFHIHMHMKEVVQDADSELSPLQILILRTLVNDGEMSLIELAQRVGKDKSQITRVIQDLEKMQIVYKERSKIDRRSFNLKLNKNVKEKVSFFVHKEHEIVTDMLAGIETEDIHKLESLFAQMLENLKAGH